MGCGTRLCSQRCIRALPVTLPDYSVVEKPASICPVTGLLVGWELLSVSHSTQYARKPKTARASDTTIVIRDFHSAPHPTAPSTASIYPAHTNLPQSRGFVERHPRRYRTHTTLASPFGPPILSPSHQISRRDSVTADFNQPYTTVPRDARVNSSGRSIERQKKTPYFVLRPSAVKKKETTIQQQRTTLRSPYSYTTETRLGLLDRTSAGKSVLRAQPDSWPRDCIRESWDIIRTPDLQTSQAPLRLRPCCRQL